MHGHGSTNVPNMLPWPVCTEFKRASHSAPQRLVAGFRWFSEVTVARVTYKWVAANVSPARSEAVCSAVWERWHVLLDRSNNPPLNHSVGAYSDVVIRALLNEKVGVQQSFRPYYLRGVNPLARLSTIFMEADGSATTYIATQYLSGEYNRKFCLAGNWTPDFLS